MECDFTEDSNPYSAKPESKKMKAAVYVRISRPDEAAILENQKKAALAYVQTRGWELVGVYQDITSGGKVDRPGMSALQDDGRARKFNIVVFTSLSRMTRGGISAALYLLNQLKGNSVGWHFVDQPVLNFDAETSPLVRDILLSVLAAVDEDYRRTISTKTKAALGRRRGLGIQLGRHKNDCQCKKHGGRKNQKALPGQPDAGDHPAAQE
jgi:DNA invertase Pin-like site-specific DNA recombinase